MNESLRCSVLVADVARSVIGPQSFWAKSPQKRQRSVDFYNSLLSEARGASMDQRGAMRCLQNKPSVLTAV
jgi:hypothetical protein